MQFQILAATSLLAMASALPYASNAGVGEVGTIFTLEAISTDTPEIQGAGLKADKGHFYLNHPGSGSSCGPEFNGQFFRTAESAVYLYTDYPPNELYTVRSAMGQGLFGYSTGVQSPFKNAERTGWVFDSENNLTLDGAGFIACPNAVGGGWSVWVDAGISNPGGNSECVPITVRGTTVDKPVKCMYS